MVATYTDLAYAAGAETADLPDGAWSVLSAFDRTSGIPLTWMPFRDVQAHWFGGGGPGVVSHFTLEGNKLYLFSPPRIATTVRVLHEGAITDLADTSGSEPVFPSHYHHALLDGAMELAYRDDQNAELAQMYKADFDDAMSDALREFSKPRGGRNVPLRNDYFETGVGPLHRGG